MFLLLFGLWVVFNGRLTWEIAAFGAVLSAALSWFAWKFLDLKPLPGRRALGRAGWLVRYAGTLAREIVRSNAALVRLVYGRREPKPRLVSFRTPLAGRASRAALADSITLTPGTITVTCEDDRMTVHCLDTPFAEGIEDCVFQRLLAQREKGGGRA